MKELLEIDLADVRQIMVTCTACRKGGGGYVGVSVSIAAQPGTELSELSCPKCGKQLLSEHAQKVFLGISFAAATQEFERSNRREVEPPLDAWFTLLVERPKGR